MEKLCTMLGVIKDQLLFWIGEISKEAGRISNLWNIVSKRKLNTSY